jgi:hypothetical protein
MNKSISKVDKNAVISESARFYLESSDFNGIPLGKLSERLNISCKEICDLLRCLITENVVGILTSEWVNPHIIQFGFLDVKQQIISLDNPDPNHTCIYLKPPYLENFIPDTLYGNEPYRREIALGAPQLSFRIFDLMVLEHYRNDPRYLYQNDDVNGWICISDDYLKSLNMPDADKVLLKTFGFAYDDDMNRAVAVFIRYLADLSSEHQQIWRAKELKGNYKLHPDYYESNIRGNLRTNVSICDAFLSELQVINLMARAMGRDRLFIKDFGQPGEKKPRDFSFLIRPTSKEYHSFVLLLDRMLSDNINQKFFGSDISWEIESKRKDGRIQVNQKGTLQALNEWLRKYYRTSDWRQWEEDLKTLKEIRKIRQIPAHKLDDDHFDQQFFKKQRDLIIRAFTAVRTIRLLLQNHPAVKASDIEIPEFLTNNHINTQ